MMTGLSLVHVPYRGSAPALTDLLGGQVQAMFDSVTASIYYVAAFERLDDPRGSVFQDRGINEELGVPAEGESKR